MDSPDPEALNPEVDFGAAKLQRWFLRSVAAIYLVGFAIAWNQAVPLFGKNGLTPLDLYQDRLIDAQGSWNRAFDKTPGIFWQWSSDTALKSAAALGFCAAILAIAGIQHLSLFLLMWILYLSFCHAGQIWYSFGWETLLLETGFLCLFVAPLTRLQPRAQPVGALSAPALLRWLCSWLLFRLMFGAGMIKIRGDECWRDLSCLFYHYETQPNPHPLSPLFHRLPHPMLEAGVVFNHVVELIVPFFLFVPPLRNLAVLLTILFQITLILSGNLAFLNWLTIAVAIGCFEPGRWPFRPDRRRQPATALPRQILSVAFLLLVGWKSVDPFLNLLSSEQRMNSSYDPLHLVNSYGAFGSIGRERLELVIEGSADSDLQHASWKEYVFPCKPGPVDRRPCLITPYHLRLDWELWFAAMGTLDRYSFLVNLAYKLLHQDPGLLSLLAENPFPDRPPHFVRIDRYRYKYASGKNWWTREKIESYLRPVSAADANLLQVLEAHGWRDRLAAGSDDPPQTE